MPTTNIAIGPGATAQVINLYGVSIELFEKYVKELAVTDIALLSFFKILNEQQVPRSDLDSKLREIAAQHKELLSRLEMVQSEDPQVLRLKGEARQAIELGEYAKAEELLNQAEARDVQAIEELEQAAMQRRISAAASCVDNAKLQRMQFRYEKAAAYYQKAAALLPDDKKQEQAACLGAAGYDLLCIARYVDALHLFEQSLSIFHEFGSNLKAEATLLNNISEIYSVHGNYEKALEYLEKSLEIFQIVDDKEGTGTALNNIGQLYQITGDYSKALRCLEESLPFRQEIGDKEGEACTLNNIGEIHRERGDYAIALTYYQQALIMSQENGDRKIENTTMNNIGLVHHAQGNYSIALKHYKQSLAIKHKIGDRRGEGETLSNIGLINSEQAHYVDALDYFLQSMKIQKEIGDKKGMATTMVNIGGMFAMQGNLEATSSALSQAVELMQQINHPSVENYRQALENIRAKLREPSFLGRISSFFTGR